MIYHCIKEWNKLIDFLESVKGFDGYLEVFKHFPKRSDKENRYQHLAFKWFAIQTGYNAEFVKQVVYKRWVNPETFVVKAINEKTGEEYEYIKSTSEINTKDTEMCLQRFRMYSAENGIDIAEPNDTGFWNNVKNEIEKLEQYL